MPELAGVSGLVLATQAVMRGFIDDAPPALLETKLRKLPAGDDLIELGPQARRADSARCGRCRGRYGGRGNRARGHVGSHDVDPAGLSRPRISLARASRRSFSSISSLKYVRHQASRLFWRRSNSSLAM